MKKRWRRVVHILLAISILLLAVCLLLLGLLQSVPQRYQQALDVSEEVHAQHAEELSQILDSIESDIGDRSRLVFNVTQSQLNAWLARELEANPNVSLPVGIRQPRVFITRNGLTLMFTIERSRFSAVISVVLDVRLAEQPNTIEVHLVSVHAGKLPIRIKRVFDEIEGAMARSGIQFQWKSGSQRQVALITIPDELRVHKQSRRVTLTALRFRNEEIEVRADLD